MDDPAQFLTGLKNGDQAEWEHFYRDHLRPLRDRLGRHFHSLPPEEVDDIWATAIEKVFQTVERVREPMALGSWLWTVARHEGLTYLKKKKRHTHLPIIEELLDDERGATSDVEVFGDDAAMTRLREAFEALPPIHRTVLVLRHQEGMPAEVIYGLTGLTPAQQRGVLGNVRSRFRDEAEIGQK